jgi:hypothetical protein
MDPTATPPTQATRLVGSNNHKYTPAHLVTIDYGRTDRLYTPTEFPPVPLIACDAIPPLRSTRAPVRSYEASRGRDLVERARRWSLNWS